MLDSELNMFTPNVADARALMGRLGFTELHTAAAVDDALRSSRGTSLVFVNSMCGCTGGIARPAAGLALRGAVKPDHLYTVFAGQDKEATARAREYFLPYPPSSPSIALLRDGKLLFMLERHQIEGRDPQAVAQAVAKALQEHCAAV